MTKEVKNVTPFQKDYLRRHDFFFFTHEITLPENMLTYFQNSLSEIMLTCF